MIHTRCLAILDTQWGYPGEALSIFRINHNNFTGRRLYWLIGHNGLLVTNACKEQVGHPKEHGTPDPKWLAENLQKAAYELLLVCGGVARKTFEVCGYTPTSSRVLYIPHPAARGKWNKKFLEDTRVLIQTGAH